MKLVDESSLLILARVLQVGPKLASPEGDGSEYRATELEPIEWLRGGLDGDRFEVMTTPHTLSPSSLAEWQSLAAIDTVGALVALRLFQYGWRLHRDPEADLPLGYQRVSQREFRTVRDAYLRAREDVGIDSLVLRADLVAVVSPAGNADPRHPERIPVRLDRRLKGIDPGEHVSIRPWRIGPLTRSVVICLRKVGKRTYEPIPVHRLLDAGSFSDLDTVDSVAIALAVTDVEGALGRLDAARAHH